ncbi:hypothetical protein [Rhizosphaericola mali]|uniref:Transposase n=1 Tax=Rhizosphaericola mali TaxID=2545455 RepID=A0A5P2G0M1_9BACT|nr:hypothetical protein [Rhizosphaericola mali]QES88727.1 hypothetical protein E0W69_008710 [Rhizosphaericola mali]
MKTIRIYPNKKAANNVPFLCELPDTFGFPIQLIQTDWSTEFFNAVFQYELHENFIKYKPLKPYSLHLIGKSRKTTFLPIRENAL